MNVGMRVAVALLLILTTVNFATAAYPSTDGLLAYWAFEETSSPSLDAVGYENAAGWFA